jgi:hypothetical protein
LITGRPLRGECGQCRRRCELAGPRYEYEGRALTVLELARLVLPVEPGTAVEVAAPRRRGRPRKNSASIPVEKPETGGRLLRLWDRAITLGLAYCTAKRFKPNTNRFCRYCHNYGCDLRGSRVKA